MTPEQKEWLKRPTVLPPCLRQIEGTKYWEFVEEYRISLPPPDFPNVLVLPVGWRYDRASIPEFASFLINRDQLGTLSPAPHDAGYQCHGAFTRNILGFPYIVNDVGEPIKISFTRKTVDDWFLMYMLRQRIPSWRAYTAYNAVRAWWGFREVLGTAKRW